MHVSFALFADAANLSQEGKLNILGVFDAVQVASLPTVHPRVNLVVRLKGNIGDIGSHSVTLRWMNPRGAEVWRSTATLDVNAPPIGAVEMDLPLIASLDLPMDQAGEYMLGIDLDEEMRADVRLQVHTGNPPSIAPGTLLS
jgi:hypothetical protein